MARRLIPGGLYELPLPARWGILAGASAGVIGGIVGLVIGLFAYAQTAWFAMFELGVPAAVVGGLVGLLAGLIVTACRHVKRRIVSLRSQH